MQKGKGMKIDILGTEYTISEQTAQDNNLLQGADGYCDWTSKEIVISKDIDGNLHNLDWYKRKVKRHEILHAFASESGLNECSDWARNEEMIDWIAYQGLKIIEAWKAAGAI